MSSVDTVSDSSSDEYGMNDLAAELKLEICSCLEVHDQQAMRKVCKRWRSDLSSVFLSRYVDMDASKMPSLSIPGKHQAEYCDEEPTMDRYYYYTWLGARRLEHALNLHLHKNTKLLVVRNGYFQSTECGVMAKVIQDKQANLIQLILQDCVVAGLGESGTAARYWLDPQLYDNALYCLIPTTRKLILDNYMIHNVLGFGVDLWLNRDTAYGYTADHGWDGGKMRKKLPTVLHRHVFDRSQPLTEHYRSFIMALDASCPEVSPEVREDVVQLYNSWIHSEDAEDDQWRTIGTIIKSLNEGVPVLEETFAVDVAALRQLDPLTFNTLTTELLHRIYCLPPVPADPLITEPLSEPLGVQPVSIEPLISRTI